MMLRWIANTRPLRRIRREDGMTMIEVVIAAFVLMAGSLAVLSLVSTQAHTNYRAEASQVVTNRLQEEMEKIKSLPFSQIALTGIPTDAADTSDPRWRIAGSSFATAQNGSNLRGLVYNGSALDAGGTVSGGAVSPTPETFSSGDVSGAIYRFVTWEDDTSCPESECPGAQDLKRVVVAIRLDTTAAGGARHYQELQSQVFDPNATGADDGSGSICVGGSDCYDDDGDNGDDPDFDGEGECRGTDCEAPPPGSNDPKPWLFFLTDTTCDNSSRQPITADHLVHNTNGTCTAGKKDSTNCTTVLLATSCDPGAPDLMFTQAPPFTGESPLYDYATDVEPAQNPGLDKGLQMPRPSTNGCLSSLFQPLTNATGALIGDPSPTRMQEIHKWLSPPIPSGFDVTLSSSDPGVLNLWTQTINNETYTGRICIWLFERHLNVLGVPVDTPAVFPTTGLTYFTYQPAGGVWPQTWRELHIQLPFNLQVNLGPNSRLGLAIQVERSGTTGGGLQFMYDEPSFDSRLEVKTTSALPF